MALGTPQVTAGLGMDPVWADFGAFAALDTGRFVAPDPVLAQGGAEAAGSGHRPPGLAFGPGFLRNDFFR